MWPQAAREPPLCPAPTPFQPGSACKHGSRQQLATCRCWIGCAPTPRCGPPHPHPHPAQYLGTQLIEASFAYDTASFAAHRQLLSCCQAVAKAATDARRQLDELQSRRVAPMACGRGAPAPGGLAPLAGMVAPAAACVAEAGAAPRVRPHSRWPSAPLPPCRCAGQPGMPQGSAAAGEPPSGEPAVERCRRLQRELDEAGELIQRLQAQMSDGQRELLREVSWAGQRGQGASWRGWAGRGDSFLAARHGLGLPASCSRSVLGRPAASATVPSRAQRASQPLPGTAAARQLAKARACCPPSTRPAPRRRGTPATPPRRPPAPCRWSAAAAGGSRSRCTPRGAPAWRRAAAWPTCRGSGRRRSCGPRTGAPRLSGWRGSAARSRRRRGGTRSRWAGLQRGACDSAAAPASLLVRAAA